jgi:signal transduction histidine kinase
VTAVVKEFKDTEPACDLSVEVTVDADTPLVVGDDAALACVVWNLLENAVKYSPGCKTVWIDVGLQDACAVIRVRDRGRGITQADQCRIFEKYVRGSSARNTDGTGIGLAMVDYIVQAHRGTIHLNSEVGEGSTFTILLPANVNG